MLILFIYVSSISFGHFQMIKYQDIIPLYNKNMSNSEQMSSRSRDSQKKTELQLYDSRQDAATTKTIDNLKDFFSIYRRKNCLTDKTVYEEPHNKELNNYMKNKKMRNEFIFQNQKKEVQFETPIVRNNFDNPNSYNHFQLSSYLRDDIDRSGQSVDSYDGTNFDDIKSTRRFAHNIFNQNITSDEIKTSKDHSLLPGKSQTQSEENQRKYSSSDIINSNGKEIEINNYNDIPYDDDEDNDDEDEYRSSSKKLEKLNNDIANQFGDPTKGLGISEMTKSRIMIMKHPRVCYACSSTFDLSCWTPNRITSVKYCHEGHTSCLTKVFKDKEVSYIIRDCGSTCVPSRSLEYKIKYDYCTICHTDLCNNDGVSTKVERFIERERIIKTTLLLNIC
ncbi:NAD-dependent protein deacetylase Sir2B-like [Nymphalis io]|uniref:NAD-dependent protein deacetylase Sir2B-like n=1 Tax=Inachis io TaxID=171585 RepID=UPI002168EAA4|nr:NAD-dependent protein deacetylase Sir2B-like [Nymphalis io]